MVAILALCIYVVCLRKCSLYGSSAAASSKALRILSLISPAAALVNVTTRRLSMSTGSLPNSPLTMEIILSTNTAVLPEPAAADTSKLQSLVSITLSCSLVHLVFDILILLSFILLTYIPLYLQGL